MDQFIQTAIEEAKKGAEEGGIPIGAALIDHEGRLIATGRNRRVQDESHMMHAEINCMHHAGVKGEYDLWGSVMYSTLMPCNMCAGAAVQFGVMRVIVGESENFRQRNGLEVMQRYGVEVVELDLDEPKELLREFIQKNPTVWKRDIER